jgi:hypothetical protein
MSTLAELNTAVSAYKALLDASNVAYKEFYEAYLSIDTGLPTAQAELDAIAADRAAFAATALPNIEAAKLAYKEAQANLGPEDTEAGSPIVATIATNAENLASTTAKLEDIKPQIQRNITEAAPIPRPNVQPPTSAPLPTPRQVDNAIAKSSTKSSEELNRFISMVKGTGLAISSKYSVVLPPIAGFDTAKIALQCTVSGMPDITLSGGDSRIYGEASEMPSGVAYGMLSLSFLLTNEFDSLAYFEAWSNLVFNRLTRAMGYYRDFAFPITVQVLDKMSNPRYTVFYIDCWPKSINSSGLSYDSHNTMAVNVSLQYKYWISSVTGKLSDSAVPPWNGVPPSLKTLSQGPLSSITGIGAGLDLASSVDIYGGNGLAASSIMGPLLGSNILTAANQAAANLTGLTNMSDGTQVGSLLSKYASQLGTSSSVMGAGIGGFASNLQNILAPATQIAAGVAGLSGTLRSMDNLLGRLGIRTNIGNTVTDLNGVVGQISVLGQLNGIPGAMSSLGSSIGSISGDIANIQRSLVNVPGATSAMASSLGNLSNVFNSSSNTISALGNMTYSN